VRKLLFALAALAALLSARLFGGPMDGTSWDVKIKPDSLFSFSRKETLVFAHGRLEVLAPAPSDFSPGVYNAQAIDGTTADAVWSASMSQEEKGVMSWHGLVRGDTIEGFAVLWTKSGQAKHFSFRGSRREG
jgi:hypothetical protein